jgi:prepilin-type N-terminal cleavage/methylation domain-containing protein
MRFVSVRGVSLIELLLAVALIAVIAAIGMPTVYHNFVRESEQHVTDSVLLELEYARSMGLMDLPAYATFKTVSGKPDFECATQTKKLDGNVVFVQSEMFAFDNLGRLLESDGATRSTVAKTLSLRTADKVIGSIEITPAGLIKRQ